MPTHHSKGPKRKRRTVQGFPFGKTEERARIVEHADVRRNLMNIKAVTDGLRALVFKAYLMEGLANAATKEDEKEAAATILDLLTRWSKPTDQNASMSWAKMEKRHLDDYQVGEVFRLSRRTVTKTDIVVFSMLRGDRHLLHTNVE